MKIYVVVEEDRGLGPTIIGVYASEKMADEVASKGRYMSIFEEELINEDVDESADNDYSRRELRNRRED